MAPTGHIRDQLVPTVNICDDGHSFPAWSGAGACLVLIEGHQRRVTAGDGPIGRPPSDGTPPLRGSVCQRANGGVDRSYLERPVNCESGAQEEARCDESNNSSASNEGGSSSEETIPVGNSNDGPLLRISGIEVGAHDVGNDRDHRGRGGAAASSVARDSERRRRRREMLREMAHNYENAVLSLDAPAQRHTQASSERRTISRKKARVNCFLPPSIEARLE